MSSKPSPPEAKELLGVVAVALTGGGVLTLAVFPLALPILILTLVAVLPLVAVGIVIAVPLALLAAPVVLIRRLRRRTATRHAEPSPRRSICDVAHTSIATHPRPGIR